jgi:pimeloyl-ACP methyl ester carboxylesterase
MPNLRVYGNPPYSVAVIHGGPGAPGYMAPVARTLSVHRGILEPLHTAASLDGQVAELAAALSTHAALPATLIGSSWGAVLGYIFTARFPDSVKKLVLVGSGVFEETSARNITQTRLDRLGEAERKEAVALMDALDGSATADKNAVFGRLGMLLTKADILNPLTLDIEVLEPRYHVYAQVWKEAAAIRKSGALLTLGKQIRCPTVAIHGDYDAHPAEGVRKPLARVLKHFRFILLKNCGHMPWLEKEASEPFYRILNDEIDGVLRHRRP